jgi:ribosomal 30S subunit maturation factor RimM
MGEDAIIPIGKIVGTHGIKSHLKVISCGDSVDLFAPGKELAVSLFHETPAPAIQR